MSASSGLGALVAVHKGRASLRACGWCCIAGLVLCVCAPAEVSACRRGLYGVFVILLLQCSSTSGTKLHSRLAYRTSACSVLAPWAAVHKGREGMRTLPGCRHLSLLFLVLVFLLLLFFRLRRRATAMRSPQRRGLCPPPPRP